MRLKCVIIALIGSLTILSSCAEETCPVAMKSDLQYFSKKKIKGVAKHRSKRKPTPSLIHITRINYKPQRHGGN